jgi:valyl-tRNA synthetase
MTVYLIDVPPPTISGHLHMGHVFSYSHMDFVARWRRMKGDDLVYPFCCDNNGLPSEKLCIAGGATDLLAREILLHEYQQRYVDHFKSLQQAFDYTSYYTTGSTGAKKLCLLSFEDLKSKGLAYKAETEFLYCPETGTSVSQSELDANGCFERSGVKAVVKRGEGWFVKILDNIPHIRKAIESINWHPEKFKFRLLKWLDEVKYDWSISRTRSFGIPIPGESGMTFDTWFISSLSPQLAYNAYKGHLSGRSGNLPMTLDCPVFDVRFQAHDILRTWALFTIVKSLYHNDQIPWKNVVVSGHALADGGGKISKSLGNATKTPTEYISEFGAAGVRYWTSLNRTGTDTRIDPNMMAKGKRLVTKIRNAGIFLDAHNSKDIGSGEDMEVYHEWATVRDQIDILMGQFDWSSAVKLLTSYFWETFCSKRIEQSKKTPINFTLGVVYDQLCDYFTVFLGNFQ